MGLLLLGPGAMVPMALILAVLVLGLLLTTRQHPRPPHPAAAASPNVLRIGIPAPSTLDPVLRANPSDLLIDRQLYEPLVGFDPQTQALVPRLASSWDVLDGGKTFRFHLRPGAHFHDGVTVTAADLAFELNRLARKDTNSSIAHLMEPVVGYDKVHGTGEATQLEGVTADDPHTLTIALADPWYQFPYVLTDPATAPLQAAEFQADPAAFIAHPYGSGPYALAPGTGLAADVTLQRSPSYWGAAPPIPTVHFVTVSSPAAISPALAAGQLDVADVPAGTMAAALAQFGSRGYSPVAAEIILGFNLKDPALADPRLRQAVSLAINRMAIAGIYGSTVAAADGLVPRGLPGHTELTCAAACAHDPDKAKALVQQVSGTAQPFLALDYPEEGPGAAVAAELIRDLAAAGIQLLGRPHSADDFFSTLSADHQQLFLQVWVADYPLDDWFLAPLFTASSPDNHTGYSDPTVQSLIAQSRSTSDPSVRLGLDTQIEQKLVTDLPMTPLVFFRNHYAASPRVRGFYVDLLGGFDVAKLSLGPATG